MPSLLDFVFNKRKPIPGEWEYDIHPYSQEQVYEAPLYQGEQWGLMDDLIPTEPTPTEPAAPTPTDDPSWSTEISLPVKAWGPPSGGAPGSKNISQHMADWILTNYPEQETWDRYQISGWDVAPGAGSYADDPDSWTPLYNNPILSYGVEHNSAYLNSPEYKSYMESISGIPKSPPGLLTGGSDGITTPLPSIPSPSPIPMPVPIPDNSLPSPIEGYNSSPHGAGSSDQFSEFLDSVPPGVYTHENMLKDFLGRPLNAEELYMLDLNNNQFNMPVIDPDNWEPPKNNGGLLGIVGGGLIPDAGPISDSPIPTY